MDSNTISISALKTNPAMAIAQAVDYPLEVISRGKSQGYLVSKQLFEALIERLENAQDKKTVELAIKNGDLEKASDFEEFAKELGI